MSSDHDLLASRFEEHRPHLVGVAYRLTGRLADAEDAVQESWLRLTKLDQPALDEIRELGAWLTTVVGRICLDRMRSAAAQREQYVGPWLPEPIVTSVDDSPGPLAVVVQREDMRMAAQRVLHELSPDQRLAFVLHDGFNVPFAEIAEIIGCGVATARQHASRGRKRMADAEPPPRGDLPEQQRLLDEFLAAVSAGDIAALTRVLHPDAVVYGDGGGQVRTARRPIVGSDKVARFALGLVTKYGLDALVVGLRPIMVNGDYGLVLRAPDIEIVSPRVMTVSVRDGRIAEIFDVVNPDKLRHVEL